MNPQPERPARSDATDPIALALEIAVYAPIGAAAYLREVGPDFVRMIAARGRAEVEVVQEQVAARVKHAKGAGEVAIAFGLPLVRKKVGERLASLRPEADAPPRAAARAEPAAPREAEVPPVTITITAAGDGRRAAHTNGHGAEPGASGAEASGDEAVEEQLSIPGYDALSASQVVERLAGLSVEELAAVRRYETGHRRRRTILGKIEQLSN
jgi:hypothetical protein